MGVGDEHYSDVIIDDMYHQVVVPIDACMGGEHPRPRAPGSPRAENLPGQPEASKWQSKAGNTLLLPLVSLIIGQTRNPEAK